MASELRNYVSVIPPKALEMANCLAAQQNDDSPADSKSAGE